jgi:SAM-dependent methyltransferase
MPAGCIDVEALKISMESVFSRSFSADLARAYFYIDSLCLHLCFHIAHECRLSQARSERLTDLCARIGVVPDALYLLNTVLDILQEEGYVQQLENGCLSCRPCPQDRSAEVQREARLSCPQALPTLQMIERCHDNALAFLSGRKSGMEVIFPRGDTWLWERVQSEDAVMSIYADLLPPPLEALLGRGARLLEVGAGVGAVVRRCLPILREHGIREYWFTDLGKLFVQQARRLYGEEPFMLFRTLDVDLPFSAQGVAPETFDAVIAVNVLHVAKEVAFTLREIHAALKTSGWLICAEGSVPDRIKRWRLDLVFAFLRGWWDVSTDQTLRPRPGFLMPSQWKDALQACGYRRVYMLPGEDWFAGPCRGGLILAQKALGRAREHPAPLGGRCWDPSI